MEHEEALERIELAAAEPSGLDRLMAGDTAEAAAIAGHLAGCPACVAELARIRRTSAIAREVIRTQPDPSLRARTLEFVRAAGVQRGETSEPAAPAVPPAREAVPAAPSRGPSRRGGIAAAAAIAIVALGAGYLAGAPARDARDAAEREAALLGQTVATTLRVQAQPDATRIELVATDAAPGGAGTLQLSAAAGELVMVAAGLAAPATGEEYGCWVEAGGVRERIGRMYRAGDLWTWAGPVDGLEDLPPDAVFGVSLGAAGGGGHAVPVLLGGGEGAMGRRAPQAREPG